MLFSFSSNTINIILLPSFFYKELNLILGKSNHKKIVLELPLIETRNNIKFNFIIVSIKTSLKIREKRYLSQSESKSEDFIILNKYQKSSEYYEKYSDYLISNNDTMEILQIKFNELYSKFKE